MPKVSVIIPVYNVEQYLRQCLDSVVNQTLSDIEIICVDDCSTDNSLQILQEYAERDSRIKIIEQKENQGQGVARNTALDNASGDYIMFLDPDDWYELNACELAYNQIIKNQNDMTMFLYKKYYEGTKTFEKCSREELYRKFFNIPNIDISKIEKFEINDSIAWGLIYKKDFLDKYNIRFATCRMFEDQWFAGRTYIYAKNISILNAYLYNYRIRESSTTYTKLNCSKDFFKINKDLFTTLIESNPSKILIGNIILYRLRTIFNWQYFYSKYGIKIKLDYYRRMRKCFIYLNKNINIDDYKDIIGIENYNKFERVLKKGSLFIFAKWLLGQIFSVKNEYRDGVKHKIITILGIKIKI